MGHQSGEDSVLIIVEGHPFAAAVGVGRVSIRRSDPSLPSDIQFCCDAPQLFKATAWYCAAPNVRTTAHEAARVHHAARRRGDVAGYGARAAGSNCWPRLDR